MTPAITAFLDSVKERLANAMPGPWRSHDWPSFPRLDEYDYELIAHAPHDLKLLTEMLEVALGALEKINNFYVDYELGELGEEAKLSCDALKQIAAMAEGK